MGPTEETRVVDGSVVGTCAPDGGDVEQLGLVMV